MDTKAIRSSPSAPLALGVYDLRLEGAAETTSARIVGRQVQRVTSADANAFNATTGNKVWALIQTLPPKTQAQIIGGGGLGLDSVQGDAYTLVIVRDSPEAKRHQMLILRAFQGQPEVLDGYGLRVMIRPMAVAY